MRPPGPVDYYRREAQTSEEVAGELVITRGDPTKVLQPTEYSLDHVTLPIRLSIKWERFIARAPARDDGLRLPRLEQHPKAVRIITLVTDQDSS